MRPSITFGCTLSGLTCMCVMRFSSDELCYKRINVTIRLQHLNLHTHSSSQHYTAQSSSIQFIFLHNETRQLYSISHGLCSIGPARPMRLRIQKLGTIRSKKVSFPDTLHFPCIWAKTVILECNWFNCFILFVILIILAESYSLVATRALTGVVIAGDYLTVKQDVWV